MKIDEAVSILRAHNEWRRAPAHLPDDAMPAMGDPRLIGVAIDTVCDALSKHGDWDHALRLADECEESAQIWAHEIDTRQRAAAELRRLHVQAAQKEEDARDAERYRLLRRKICIAGGEFHILNLDPRYIAPDAAVELDAAIDAELAKVGAA